MGLDLLERRSRPASNDLYILCVIGINRLIQESPSLKPDCLGRNKYFHQKR